MQCYLFDAPSYLVFAPGVPDLLYYSHIPTTIIALLVAVFVLLSNPSGRANRLLFLIVLAFTTWTSASLISWTNVQADLIAFIWPLFAISSSLIAVFSIYFAYAFFHQANLPFWAQCVLLALITPVLALVHTDFSFSGFDLTNCDAFAYEGIIFKMYYTLLGFIAMIWIAVDAWQTYRTTTSETIRKQVLTMAIGLEFFLFSFITTSFIVTYLVNVGLLPDSRLEMYGLFGMTFFIGVIAYIIVHFKAFNIKLAGAQALVIGLLSLVGALLFVVKSPTSQVVAGATFFFTAIAGYFLVRSVKREIKQREELQVLTGKLARANDRLKELDKLKSEFVSIASHQMRSPLTSMRGYASMILDGSYGVVPPKVNEVVQRIADSSAFMAKMIENYLNVSRIESGNMKYELSDFNLKLEVEKVVDDKRQEAIKKGLLLTFKSSLNGQGIVHADIGKTLEIIHNLLNNALKYTPKGSIDVFVHDDPKKKKIYVDIHDSGIGMTANDIAKLFGKFERAENANTVNITGTGLGLYVARTMALAMNGEITASSEGQGLGSTFRFELPMMM